MPPITTIAVDFDNTLICRNEDGDYVPAPGAAKSMRALRDDGCRIIVHSCRTGIAFAQGDIREELSFMKGLLERFGIVYDEIYTGDKLIADFYIDDRAISYRGDWSETLAETKAGVGQLNKRDKDAAS